MMTMVWDVVLVRLRQCSMLSLHVTNCGGNDIQNALFVH
jgi:hypothetical protein